MKNNDEKLDINENIGAELVGQNMFISETTIFRCTEGTANVLINGNLYNFSKNTNFIVIDSAHFVIDKCNDSFKFITICFGRKAFNRIYTHIDASVLNPLKYSSPELCSVEQYKQCELTLDKIMLLNDSDIEYKRNVMRNLIFCYIYEMYNLTLHKTENVSDSSSHYVSSLISKFIILCRNHHREHRDIQFYSDSLYISRRYLYTIVMKKLNVTPKEFLDGYVIASAKKLLLNTKKTTQEISDELNFPDQSTFGQFFKRISSFSPSQFRKVHK